VTKDCFDEHVPRLATRFGEKAFDVEFKKLLAREMASLPNDEFIKIVEIMIGTRPPNRPPVLTDFREMRLQAEKSLLSRETRWAATELKKVQANLPEVFEKAGYGKISNISEALEIAKIKLRAKKTDEGE
jgi:hypothetical protein